jgi:hypothetical protein
MNTALSQKSTCSPIGLNTEEKSFQEAANTFETKPMNTALSQKSTCSPIGLNTEEKSFQEAANTFETKPGNTFTHPSNSFK